jgi:hypothetical protein
MPILYYSNVQLFTFQRFTGSCADNHPLNADRHVLEEFNLDFRCILDVVLKKEVNEVSYFSLYFL